MPRFDGTGPGGEGPLTGRGEGYCAVPLGGPGAPPYGVAGLEGRPVSSTVPARRWYRPSTWFGRGIGRGLGRGYGRGRGRGARRGRGRRSGGW
jgi:hypothetical protein